MTQRQLKFEKISIENEIERIIQTGLKEDLSNLGDITTLSTIPPTNISNCYFLAKASGIISGIKIAEKVFQTIDNSIKFHWLKCDGDTIIKGEQIGLLTGNSQSILTGERLALNLMQRMSGIATQTNKMVTKIKKIKSNTILLDTRKTVPGLRIIDKIAVKHGGGNNHRIGLYDMILIKDNHITASKSIKNAIFNAKQYLIDNKLYNTKIEIETSNINQIKEVLKYGKDKVNRIMLDNMVIKDKYGNIDVSLLQKALKLINGKYETEASGNITLESIQKVASTNVDYVSTGSITHSVIALDISLKFHDHNHKL